METMIHERDEWLLNRFLDAELSAEEERLLHRRLEAEPPLRAALDALRRIDRALADRRLDEPVVDWGRLHAGIMQTVTPQAAPAHRVIRFPAWLRVAMPLAAAAAIALMVLVHDPRVKDSTTPTPGIARQADHTAAPVHVVFAAPTRQSGGRLDVRIHRRATDAAPTPVVAGVSQVAYTRSTELDDHIRQIDQSRQSQSSWQVYTADTMVQPAVMVDFLDIPPL